MTRDKYGIPLYANSTLLSMTKSELLGYIRTIEHNWRSAEQTIEIQAENCKRLLAEESNKAIDDFVEQANVEIYKDFNFADVGEYSINDVSLTLYRVAEQLKGGGKNE